MWSKEETSDETEGIGVGVVGGGDARIRRIGGRRGRHHRDQAKVLANGGFPFTISTQNTSYRLTGSLTVTTETDAIYVTANQVTIDLNGFAIVGCCGALIWISVFSLQLQPPV